MGTHRFPSSPVTAMVERVALAALIVFSTACGLSTASQPTPSGSIGLIVVPDDRTAGILNAIRSARRRVLVEMYMLTDADAVEALLAAHRIGCEVRVLLEPEPFGAPTANQAAFVALASAGVDVRWVKRDPGLVHAKLLVIDDATLLVMTLNLTAAGLHDNREYAISDANPADLGWATAIWNADATGGDPGRAPGHASLLASPIDARPRLSAAIDGARASVAIEIEEISDGDIVARLIAARDRGVSVTVVVPATQQSAATSAAVARMAAAGIAVRLLGPPAPTLHAKAMVIDRRQVYVGSVNFTRASLDDNREFGLLLTDPPTVARVGATVERDANVALPP